MEGVFHEEGTEMQIKFAGQGCLEKLGYMERRMPTRERKREREMYREIHS